MTIKSPAARKWVRKNWGVQQRIANELSCACSEVSRVLYQFVGVRDTLLTRQIRKKLRRMRAPI